MKIPLTSEILVIILAVQHYKKWCYYHHSVLNDDMHITDVDKETQEYYNTLPLPEELQKNNYDFKAVLSFPVTKEIMTTELEELPVKFNFKNF